MANGLTERQKEIFFFICYFLATKGFPPTIREIGTHFQIAPASVLGHLHALEVKGFIRRTPAKSRCLEILKEAA